MPSKYELLPTSEQSSPRSLSPVPPSYTALSDDDDYNYNNRDLEFEAPLLLNPRTRDTREAIRAFHADPRFNPPPPSPFARLALIVFCLALIYAAYATRRAIWVDFGMGTGGKAEVVDPSY